jgi:hypothetical protein
MSISNTPDTERAFGGAGSAWQTLYLNSLDIVISFLAAQRFKCLPMLNGVFP